MSWAARPHDEVGNSSGAYVLDGLVYHPSEVVLHAVWMSSYNIIIII